MTQALQRIKGFCLLSINAHTTIFIAEKDRVIPRQRTQNLNHFPGQYVDSFVIKGTDHNDISMFPDYVTGLKKALE